MPARFPLAAVAFFPVFYDHKENRKSSRALEANVGVRAVAWLEEEDEGRETGMNEQRPFALPFYWEQEKGLDLRYLSSESCHFCRRITH